MRRNMVGSLLIRLNMSLADLHLVLPKTCLTLPNLKMMKLVMTTMTIFRSKFLIKQLQRRLLKKKRKLNNQQQKQLRKKLQILFKITELALLERRMRTTMIIGMTWTIYLTIIIVRNQVSSALQISQMHQTYKMQQNLVIKSDLT